MCPLPQIIGFIKRYMDSIHSNPAALITDSVATISREIDRSQILETIIVLLIEAQIVLYYDECPLLKFARVPFSCIIMKDGGSMKSSKIIQWVLVLTSLGMLSCPSEPHSEYYFEIENNGSTNIDVIYTVLDSSSKETSLAAGRWLTIHETSVASCLEPLDDKAFEMEIESFVILRYGDTLNVQIPGILSEWEYIGWDNGGAMTNVCGGSGFYTFFINDSLYPP